MEINRCVSCEREIDSYPCPHCGFDIAKPQPEYALPYNHVLHGRFLIGKVLGQGGFGITYIGWDLALEVKVAIKEYYPNGQVTRNTANTCLSWYTNAQAEVLRQSGMETFMKEARKMARVEGIYEVVRVRDTFAENETAYIVMDFVEGQTLKSRLEKRGVLSWEEAKTIFIPVISAMEQVHQAGIVHRDLSPDNLMLLPDGKVRILDLGAAKDLTVNSGVSSMQVVKGGFSPIEQYSQAGGSGPWTDVYAMAATMYYALTGKLPPAAVDRLGEDTLCWDLPQLRALPKSALEALKKAMVVLAKDRTQSMGELLRGLEKDEGPKVKMPPKPKDPKEKPPKENTKKGKRPLLLLGAVLAVILVGIYVLGPFDASPTSQMGSMEASLAETEPKESATDKENQDETDAKIVARGRIGYNLSWTLYQTGLMVVSGQGEMADYHLSYANGDSNNACEIGLKIIKLKLEEGVTSIGNAMFAGCDDLKEVSLPESLIGIGRGAFESCDGLVSLQIPKNVQSIGYDAFRYCSSLESLELPENNVGIGQGAFEGCESLQSLIIPPNVRYIGSYAFLGCNNLTEVTIPGSMREIPQGLFEECKNLESVTILDGVTEIGDAAFAKCESLSQVTIPETVKEIENGAFYGCPNLQSVTISRDCTIEKGIKKEVGTPLAKNLPLTPPQRSNTINSLSRRPNAAEETEIYRQPRLHPPDFYPLSIDPKKQKPVALQRVFEL